MTGQQNNENVLELEVFALTMDPVYIGTGGYSIGRVDNTIVRDPITNVPKIPGSSLAGTWRYYVVLEALKDIKDKQPDFEKIKQENNRESLGKKLQNYNWKHLGNDTKPTGWKGFAGNQVMKITCAGQDNVPQVELSQAPEATNSEGKTGHCGYCIVCKGFGFSKKDISWQGMLYFSDLQILFFPVFTIKGTKWITTEKLLKELGILKETNGNNTDNKVIVVETSEENSNNYINLGWLYLPYESEDKNLDTSKLKFGNFELKPEDIVIVPESLFPHIVNSNLEVRTSVSIDPITGAAKEGALFTSEAIPRGTILYGSIRIFNKKNFEDIEKRLNPLPDVDQLKNALCDSKHYYESLGIGGMTTRGFGRLKIKLEEKNNQNTREECKE